ncbi:3527_t:CDS:2 [Ambispora leptoticha]|uniref:3527_t:CDS:1 n=1 Tax=Ambispora leptoticha TaxID=144679 RepID=A0A9N8YTJ3_9GLOM|nr:3527_t:CDS:2 [Ambispora leptoticha]
MTKLGKVKREMHSAQRSSITIGKKLYAIRRPPTYIGLACLDAAFMPTRTYGNLSKLIRHPRGVLRIPRKQKSIPFHSTGFLFQLRIPKFRKHGHEFKDDFSQRNSSSDQMDAREITMKSKLLVQGPV